MRILFQAIFISGVCALCARAVSADDLMRPITLAHRGGNVETDENTLSSYGNAIKYGMDYIECDPRLTKDGVLVIMHDAGASRTTDGNAKVADMTLEEIKKLKTKHGESVPTLEEVLSLAKEKGAKVFLDTKLYDENYMKQLTDQVAAQGMSDRVILGLWTVEQLKWMEKNRPEMETNIPYPAPVSTFKKAKKMGADWVGMIIEQTNDKSIATATAAGLKVVTMPINDREVIIQKIKEGMQVIQTDDPKMLSGIIKELFGGK